MQIKVLFNSLANRELNNSRTLTTVTQKESVSALPGLSGKLVGMTRWIFTLYHGLPKKRLFMQVKLTTFLILAAMLQVSARGFTQNVTLSAKSVTLQEVFSIIKKQTGYHFFYRISDLKETRPVTVQLKNVPFKEALATVLKNQPLSFVVEGNTVVIRKVVVPPTFVQEIKPEEKVADPVKGKVSNSRGEALMGVSVTVKGTSTGTSTDENGNYSIEAGSSQTLVFSYVGFVTQEVPVGSRSVVNIQLNEETTSMSEVVVTALGISREKKSLGYASQKISGEELDKVNSGNVTNALSGQIAGVQVKRNTNMGGSTNIIIRGYTSLTGDNQALFVLDGVPVNNANFNSAGQKQGGEGYDYGNMASDINPDDIESINVLKGAAATALYGSRAANGAVIITTKSGIKNGKPALTFNSGFTFSTIDRSTFPQYQNKYGAGYGKFYGPSGNEYFDTRDFDGDGINDIVAPNPVFGSFGGAFDPDLNIYQWNAIDPESPSYMQKKPWLAAKNGPISFFETPTIFDNSVSLAAPLPQGNYRLSYSNFSQKGLLPNSKLNKNNFAFNFTSKFFNKFTASASANYILTDAVGRNETGGDFRANAVDVFRKWWQVNIDVKELEDIYFRTRRNVSSFPNGSIGNLYWTRYENYSSDGRNRFVGNMSVKYDVNDWLNILGRISADSYTFLREERINNGSTKPGKYTRSNTNFQEFNYDLMANFSKKFGQDFNLRGLLGLNIRRNKLESIMATTNGGLVVDRLFSLTNSLNSPAAPIEVVENIGVDGYYGSASLGYKNLFYVDVTGRSDHSSTLPVGSSVYFYPSVATSLIFSELIENDVLSFGKLRLNYAEVGNSAPANSLKDVLVKPSPFGALSMYAINSVKNNPDLKPENTVSYEAGVELLFFQNRLGLDISVYKTNTKNQIMPVVVSSSTGYASKYVNAGEIENKGLEIMLTAIPVKKENFSWNVNLNWATNKSKVLSLFEGVSNLQLGEANVTLNAEIGQPYGVLKGTDFVYVDGKRLVDQANGKYVKTTSSDYVLGNINPDWIGGITNNFKYKKFSFSFLLDMKQGGSVYTQDLVSGNGTGAYEYFFSADGKAINSTGNNDLGNPIRNTLADGGGIILPGVDENGKANTVRTRMNDNTNALGNSAPNAMFVYDASYIKLRQASLSYEVPSIFLRKSKLTGATISIVGSNLWIIHKNLPYSDPEAGASSGNFQGVQSGVLPLTREIGFNLKLQF